MMTIIKAIMLFGASVLLVNLVASTLVGTVVRDSKYDTASVECNMRGIFNKTDLTKKNLTACNYYASNN